jgi:hypothetical protein
LMSRAGASLSAAASKPMTLGPPQHPAVGMHTSLEQQVQPRAQEMEGAPTSPVGRAVKKHTARANGTQATPPPPRFADGAHALGANSEREHAPTSAPDIASTADSLRHLISELVLARQAPAGQARVRHTSLQRSRCGTSWPSSSLNYNHQHWGPVLTTWLMCLSDNA